MDVKKGQIWGNKEIGETCEVLEVGETVIIKQSAFGDIKMSVPLSEFERKEIVLLEDKK